MKIAKLVTAIALASSAVLAVTPVLAQQKVLKVAPHAFPAQPRGFKEPEPGVEFLGVQQTGLRLRAG